MLQHSLELALEEADGFHDEQLLRRANVSPFFSSAKAVPTLEPTELALSATHASQSSSVVAVTPLNLELCGASAFEDGRSLSRVSSWCDFSLDSDATPLPPSRSNPVPSTVDAWDLFLEGKTPTGTSVTYALKTPTAQALPAFPAFFGEEPATTHANGDPTALSPTHIDKKVLVTDSDLKLDRAAHHAPGSVPSRERVGHPHTFSSRSKREKLFPQDPRISLVETSARPRRALLRQQTESLSHGRSHVPSHHRFSPYVAISPHTVRRIADNVDDTMAMPRLPALGYSPRNDASISSALAESPCVFPLVDHNWKRSQHQELGLSELGHSANNRRPSPADMALTPHEYAAIFRTGFVSHHPYHRTSRGTGPPMPLAPPAPRPKPRKASTRRIGIYTPEARRERLRRFHEKRKLRVFHKRIKYDCRKRLANACPRVKGRFVRKHPIDETQGQSPDGGETTEVSTPTEAMAEVA